jgi:hypothetical protein
MTLENKIMSPAFHAALNAASQKFNAVTNRALDDYNDALNAAFAEENKPKTQKPITSANKAVLPAKPSASAGLC